MGAVHRMIGGTADSREQAYAELVRAMESVIHARSELRAALMLSPLDRNAVQRALNHLEEIDT